MLHVDCRSVFRHGVEEVLHMWLKSIDVGRYIVFGESRTEKSTSMTPLVAVNGKNASPEERYHGIHSKAGKLVVLEVVGKDFSDIDRMDQWYV